MPWGPESIGGAVGVWVADDIAQSEGSAVSSWADRISSQAVTQATGTKQPAYRTAQVSSQPAVDFDGTDDGLRLGSTLSTATSGHIFVVALFDFLTTGTFAGSSDEGTATSYLYFAFSTGTTPANRLVVNQRSNADTTDSNQGSAAPSVSTPYLFEFSSTGTAYGIRRNGVSETITNGGGANNGDWFGDTALRDNFTIGYLKRSTELLTFNGKIAAVIVVDNPISSADRELLYEWVRAKYALPLPATVTIGLAEETGTAEPIAVNQTLAIGKADETDTAQTITPTAGATVDIGRADETDTAQTIVVNQTVTIGLASETDTAQTITVSQPITVTIGRADETDVAQSITPSQTTPAGPPAWSLAITARDGTPVHTFTSEDAANDGPIVAFEGQDSQNELGVAHLAVPSEHAVNDYLTEDNLAHFYERGAYVTTFIVKVPQVNVIAVDRKNELAVYDLRHVLAVGEEAVVEPPAGMDKQPASSDRTFGFMDPSFDDSGWATATDLGVYDPAGSVLVKYPLSGWIDPTAHAISTSELDTGTVTAPSGFWYVRIPFTTDHDLYMACTMHADDRADLWIDGYHVMSSEGNGLEGSPSTETAPIQGVFITAGDHVAAVEVCNYWKDPPLTIGPSEGASVSYSDNPTELIAAGLEQHADGTYGDVLWHTSGTEKVSEILDPQPGYNGGQDILQTLSEAQALGFLLDVVCSFDGTNDTAGNAWDDPVEITTKSTSGLDQFWVKDLTAAILDIDAHYDFDLNKIVIDAWNKGTHQPASGLTLSEGVNLGKLAVTNAPHTASSFAVTWTDNGRLSFHTVEETPPTGTPGRRRGLSLGAARTLSQVLRDGGSQLEQFNRPRKKIAVTHLTTPATADADMPPNYWKWSTVDIALTSRWLASGTYSLVAVSWALNANGLIDFTPEIGDLIVPPVARGTLALRRMAGPNLGGQSRIASP